MGESSWVLFVTLKFPKPQELLPHPPLGIVGKISMNKGAL